MNVQQIQSTALRRHALHLHNELAQEMSLFSFH